MEFSLSDNQHLCADAIESRTSTAELNHQNNRPIRAFHGRFRSMKEVLSHAAENDYAIICQDRSTQVALVAPHGGLIEAGTSELVYRLAQNQFSYYSFEGKTFKMDPQLRVTSTLFDEPQCLALLENVSLPIVVHGSYDWGRYYDVDIYLGGRAKTYVANLTLFLEAKGLKVGFHPLLPGTDPRNICNAGQLQAGIQIELHPDLQEAFSRPISEFHRGIADRVVDAISEFLKQTEETLAKN